MKKENKSNEEKFLDFKFDLLYRSLIKILEQCAFLDEDILLVYKSIYLIRNAIDEKYPSIELAKLNGEEIYEDVVDEIVEKVVPRKIFEQK